MKADKLIDAIGMIEDGYIEEAHAKKRQKRNIFSWQNVLKLVSALVVLMMVVTVMPKMFRKSAAGGSNGAYYASDSMMYEASDGYISDYDAKPSSSYASDEDAKSENTLTANKKLILTSSLDLETQDLDEVMASIAENIAKYGAYVQSSSVYTRASGSRAYEATIRIPADNYAEFINETKGLGNAVTYKENVQDVTDSYMDIEARLTSLKAQEDRVLEFYKDAKTIEELMSIEERLSEIRYEIEYYESQIKNYDLLVAYSTLNISVTETQFPYKTGQRVRERLDQFHRQRRRFPDRLRLQHLDHPVPDPHRIRRIQSIQDDQKQDQQEIT